MYLIKRLLKTTHQLTRTPTILSLCVGLVATSLSGCGGSSSDTDASGFLKFYNASDNAPYIYVELDDVDYTGADYGKSTSNIKVDSKSYQLSLSWKEGTSDYNTIAEQSIQITDDKVSLVVLAGDVSSPQVVTYQYEDEDPETDEDIFTFRWLNMHTSNTAIDVYMSKDDETFAEAQQLGSYTYQELSDSHDVELQSYKFYLTEAGATDVLYESEAVPFIYTTQYIMVVRQNNGPGESPFIIDLLTKSTAVVTYADIDAGAEVKLYNGLAQHDLLPQFQDKIDLLFSGVNGDHTVTGLAKGQFSDALDFADGDYSLEIRSSENAGEIAKNRFLSLSPNSDKTMFIYLTEETDESSDSDSEETEVFVNTLVVDNSTRISLYDHQVNVVNLVDDYEVLQVYFVRSNETVDNAEYDVFTKRAKPESINLENNSYEVSVIANENGSELLVAFDNLTLDSESGDLFMVIEEDANSNTGYTVKFVTQD